MCEVISRPSHQVVSEWTRTNHLNTDIGTDDIYLIVIDISTGNTIIWGWASSSTNPSSSDFTLSTTQPTPGSDNIRTGQKIIT